MSRPKKKIYELIELIRKNGPISPNRLTEISGDWRQSIDKYIRQAHKAKLIHVADFGPSPLGGNRTVKLYVVGKGVDAKRPYANERKHQEAIARIRAKRFSIDCHRDPIVEMFFGGAT